MKGVSFLFLVLGLVSIVLSSSPQEQFVNVIQEFTEKRLSADDLLKRFNEILNEIDDENPIKEGLKEQAQAFEKNIQKYKSIQSIPIDEYNRVTHQFGREEITYEDLCGQVEAIISRMDAKQPEMAAFIKIMRQGVKDLGKVHKTVNKQKEKITKYIQDAKASGSLDPNSCAEELDKMGKKFLKNNKRLSKKLSKDMSKSIGNLELGSSSGSGKEKESASGKDRDSGSGKGKGKGKGKSRRG